MIASYLKTSSLPLNLLPTGMFVLDKNYKVIAWNRQMEIITGITEDEIKSKKFSKVKFLETEAEAEIDFKQCLQSDGPQQIKKTARIKTAEGDLTLVHVSIHLLGPKFTDEAIAIISVVDISREIACSTLQLLDQQQPRVRFHNLIGKNAAMQEIYKMTELASESTATVLITGESGTGKELIASAIHYNSTRMSKPFIRVNCSALPESLLESELFGHVKGSFTGAYKDKTGMFEAASGGTVFLDEIGEISPLIQVKLLRVIQEKTIQRVGESKEVKVDMRIVAATNKNLRELVNQGLFREDLFYRLNVFPIRTVPLREHMNDLSLLVEHFIRKFKESTGKNITGLTPVALRLMMDYCWPGNVRELENCIEHAFVVRPEGEIDVDDLPQELRNISIREGLCKGVSVGLSKESSDTYQEPIKDQIQMVKSRNTIKEEDLLSILKENNWNKSETARQLGLSRVALWKKIKKFGIEDGAFKA